MAVAKVIYKSSANATPETWMDATTATATAEDITAPKTAMLADGVMTTGTGTIPTDTLVLALSRQLTGDVVLDVDPTFTAVVAADLRSLLADNLITTLRVSGLHICPEFFVGQQFGANYGNKSVLTSVVMDSASIGNSACAYARKLKSVSFPNANLEKVNYGWQGSSAFLVCTSLTDVDLPLYPTIQEQMFQSCTSLAFLDLPSVTRIRANAFKQCSSLETVVLRSSTVVTLENVNAFNDSTPFASSGSGGTIYVPSALISSYQTATNWSTLYGYGNTTFAAIEGSEYE